MEFHCTNCGYKLIVPDIHAGRKGRCPQCKEIVTVPSPAAPKRDLHDAQLFDLAIPEDQGSDDSPTLTESHPDTSVQPEAAPHDDGLLDAPAPDGDDESGTAYAELRGALGGRLTQPEKIPERKFPWVIDIFLYPLNRSALTILLICAGGSFLLRFLLVFFKALSGVIGILIIFQVIFLMLHWAGLLLLVMYLYWYFCQCVQDSAEGRIRAIESMAETPGLFELVGGTLKLLVCAAVYLAPVLLYSNASENLDRWPWILSGAGSFLLPVVMPSEVFRFVAEANNGGAAASIPLFTSLQNLDPVFWVLWGAGNFLFPMALLAMIIHERFLVALNPILILRSIARTFFSYCLLVVACVLLSLTLSTVYHFILDPASWHWAYLLLGLAFYQLLIMAHLLGRFYFKNEEKLYWDA